MAALQLGVLQTRTLTSEYHRHRRLGEFADQLLRRGAGRQRWPGDGALAGTGAEHVFGAGQRIVQGRVDTGGLEQVGGTGRPGSRLLVREMQRVHQLQPVEPHDLHGACRSADVAGV